jgi:DNA-binding transcriptional LysR family regulator
MNIKNLNLNLLKVFVAIYENRTLTQAADQIGLSQPGVSHALKQLRENFNDELFVRGPDGYHPTARARELAPPVSEALKSLQQAVGDMDHFDARTAVRTFRLCVSDYMSHAMLPVMANRLAVDAPNIDCAVSQLSYERVEDDLRSGRFDIAVMAGQAQQDTLGQQVLLSEEPVCVVSKHSKLSADNFDLEAFCAAEHVIVNLYGDFHSWVDQKLDELGMKRRVRFVLPYFNALPGVVNNTDIVGTLPRRIAEQAARTHDLQLLDMPFSFPAIDFVMTWHPRKDRDAAHVWFRNVLLDLCATI